MKQDETELSFEELTDLLRTAASDILECSSGVMAVSMSISQQAPNDRILSHACSVVADDGIETGSAHNVMQDYIHMHLINLTTTLLHIADRNDVPVSEVMHQLVVMVARMGHELYKPTIEPESKLRH